MDEHEFTRKTNEIAGRIGEVCAGEERGIVLAALLKITAKVMAKSTIPNCLEEVTNTLKRLYEDELKEIKDAN